ncbi:MAG: protein-methionine-sulfoxide reductase catalytic subunit MsrP [Pirellulales bacterium]
MSSNTWSDADDPITPPDVYYSRRKWMKAGALAGSALVTGSVYRLLSRPADVSVNKNEEIEVADSSIVSEEEKLRQGFAVNETQTAEESILNYNNFYEFTTNKFGVGAVAESVDFKTDNWTLKVDGLVDKPRNYSMSDLLKIGPPEERVYRMRCVEAWSMVIPWVGFSLSLLLDEVQPQSKAKFVAFETLYAPERMPGQRSPILEWPYVEGLRMDEAMHPLTILATGIYGKALPIQDGAPIRLVVPWKYGFKGIKSIVRISLVERMPPTSWNRFAPNEYGFYANVNPNVDHPRWSQATEQRIGEFGRRKTLMFNGYEEHVAHMYKDMDLTKFY